MKKLRLFLLLALGWLFPLVLLGSCASAPVQIEQDLSPTQILQKAQEASDAGKYKLALRYYQLFLEKYPEERERSLWARYEIALLHHKMGDDETALNLFNELIQMYAGGGEGLPQGPWILAKKAVAKIEANKKI